MTWVTADADEWYPVYQLGEDNCDPGTRGAYAIDDALVARYRAAYAEFETCLTFVHEAIQKQRPGTYEYEGTAAS